MSINNSYRIASYNQVSVRNTEQTQQKARVVSDVQHAQFSYKEQTSHEASSTSSPSTGFESFFANSAQELFYSTDNTANTNPYNFSKRFKTTSSLDESKASQIDTKRHQNYFNQIMNFERPSGNWVDLFV